MIPLSQSLSRFRTPAALAALAAIAISATFLPRWPFALVELGIAATLLFLVLRPAKPTDFRLRSPQPVNGVEHIGQTGGGPGLYHRWYFDLRLKEEAERCRRYGISMAVVVLKVQPRARTESGTWLRPVVPSVAASATANSIREVDFSTALGPSEFALCLVHCDGAGAEAAVARLGEELAGYKHRAGYAIYPQDGGSGKALVAIANARALGMQPDKAKAAA